LEGKVDAPGRTLRLTGAASAVAALAVLALGLALGRPRGGLALAIGLLLGSLNGLLARRGLTSGLPMSATSLGRLAVLSATGLGVGLLLGVDVAWLVLIGLAAAQVLLAFAAAREMLRR
jgi:hypothetical protein